MGLLTAALVAMVSLFIAPRWSFYFDVIPKIVVLLAGAAVVLACAEFWRAPVTGAARAFYALAGLTAAGSVLSTIFSTHREVSFFGSTWRKAGLPVELAVLILACAALAAISSGGPRIFLRVTVLALIPVAVYGAAQYFGIDPWLQRAAYHVGEGRYEIVRPPSTLGHASYFATAMLYAVFGGLAMAQDEISRAWKTAGIFAAGMAGFAIVLSGTRAAMLGGLAGAAFMLVRRGGAAIPVQRFAVVAAVTIAALAGFYFSSPGERLRARAHWSLEDRMGGPRLLLWRDTLRMSTAHVMVGYGPETFAMEFPKRESIRLAQAYPDFYHESPHNIFLDALISRGVWGLAALAGFTALGLFLARGAIGGMFIAIVVSQQFTAFTIPTELYFYLSLAMLASGAGAVGVARRFPLRWAPAIAFACFAAYLAVGDAMLGSARNALERGDRAAAERRIEDARRWHASADIYFSRALLAARFSDPPARLIAWRDAFEAARRAPLTADDPMNAFVNLASFYAGEGDAANVENNLRESIAAAPNWFKPHWLLSQVLVLEGRGVEARKETQIAIQLNGGKPIEQLTRR